MRIDDISLETRSIISPSPLSSRWSASRAHLPTPRRQDEKPFGVQIIAAGEGSNCCIWPGSKSN